ncbi:PEP-utilizing enzyme, partial [Actinophytocola sp.]|uniref:PEP-utilizing enzyme n=1 Tax=Actinophytocola sp. TaxID=1872138 RepID=UPI002D8046F4
AARAWWRGWLAASALKRARRLLGLREQAKFYNIFVLARAREQIWAVGRWLAERGQLAAPDDVFLLYLPQVRAALAGVPVLDAVEANRREYQREMRRKRIPQLMLSDGSDPEADSPVAVTGVGVLAGTPVSLGIATGRVRVVLDPVGVRLDPGDILVAPSTDPGWTPLFLTAGALVMETGGVNSHGAVVAREYGIPAVVGVPDATTALHTGQCVIVDGMAGTVSTT